MFGPLGGEAFDLNKILVIGGTDANGSYWHIEMRVLSLSESVTSPTQPVVVTPASGFFVEMQSVEAAFLMPAGKQFFGLSGTVNGQSVNYSYLNSCNLMWLPSSNREALRCPDMKPLLNAGPNSVSWTIKFYDGSSVTESVEWELFK